MNSFTAIIKQTDGSWIGWIKEVPGVNCQEPTKDELLETLKITLEEVLELNRIDAIQAAGRKYFEESIYI